MGLGSSLAVRHTTGKAEGRTTKVVLCSYCSAQFSYVMRRKVKVDASGVRLFESSGSTQSRADEAAQTALEKKLDKQTDMVPCPTCGRYQTAMIRGFKRRWLIRAAWTQAFLLLAAYVVWIAAINDKQASNYQGPPAPWLAPTSVILSGVIIGGSILMAVAYDPNRSKIRIFKKYGATLIEAGRPDAVKSGGSTRNTARKAGPVSRGKLGAPIEAGAEALPSFADELESKPVPAKSARSAPAAAPARPMREIKPVAAAPKVGASKQGADQRVSASCSSCGTAYKLAADLAGKKVRCKKCQQIFVVGAE